MGRLATPDDAPRLSRLVHNADRRFLTTSWGELPELFRVDPTAVLESDGRLIGVISFGWRAAPVAWLRTLLLQGQISTLTALRELSGPINAALAAQGIRLAAVTVDDWNAPWLQRALGDVGYRPTVEVVGYEKQRLDRPAAGNQTVVVRRARRDDLATVLALDAACFPLPWSKGVELLGPALDMAPYFIIAEWNGKSVGYAFVTGHHGERLFHLVRIAVAPEYRGAAIGVRLLAEIVDYCAGRGAEALTLNTQLDNMPAQRLYEWFGFVRTGEHQTVFCLEIPF